MNRETMPSIRSLLAIAATLGVLSQFAGAADRTWTGATSTTWSTAGNWDSGVPGTSDTAVFSNASPANQPRITADTTIADMRLEVDQEFRATKQCELYVSGPVTGTGKIVMMGDNNATWADNGRVELRSSANTFSGGIEITAGTVRYQGTSTLPINTGPGTGNIVVNGGTFSFLTAETPVNTSGAPQTPGDRAITNRIVIGSSGGRLHMAVGSGASDAAIIYGDIDLGGPVSLASAGGGNSYGYTIDGSITLLQDVVRTTALSSETGHNGTDFISGPVIDGPGAAGNPFRIASTSKDLNFTSLGSSYANGTVFTSGGSAKVIVRPCATLGTGNVTVQTGARATIQNLAPLGQSCALAPTATIHAEAGAAIGTGCGSASVSCTRTSGSPVITFSGTASTVELFVGQTVTGTGIPADTTVASVDSHTQATLSENATASGTSTLTFGSRALDVSSRFTSTSTGIYGIGGTTHGYNLDLATLGNGEMFVGTVLGGTFAGLFSPGAGNAFRLGGGEVSDILGTSGGTPVYVTADGALSGESSLIVGSGSSSGGAYRGFVVISGNNTFTGGTTVNDGAALMLGRTGGTPFGTGSVIVKSGGILGACGSDGTFFDGTSQFDDYRLLPGAVLLLSEQIPTANYSGSGGQGRWGDSAEMRLADNTLYFHRGKNNTAYETIGKLTVIDQVQLRAADGGGTSRYLMTADEISRTGNGVLSSFQTLGSVQRLRTTPGKEPAVVNGIVAPWILDAAGNNFMTYDGTSDSLGVVGLKPLPTYVALTSAGATDVATTGTATIAGDYGVYALKITGDVNGIGKTITIGGGGFISTTYSQTIEPNFTFPVEAILYENDGRGITFSGTVTAPAGINKCGTGLIKLSGANAIQGQITVSQGTLQLENTTAAEDWADCVLAVCQGSTANLNGKATSVKGLKGAGTVSGAALTVTESLQPGGSLYPGRTDTATLVLTEGCTSTFEVGMQNDLVVVAGDLTLDGTLDVEAAEGYSPGTFTIMTYSGSLTDNGITLGTRPVDTRVTLDTSEAGLVKLVMEDLVGATLILVR